jgi:hypothetical protein
MHHCDTYEARTTCCQAEAALALPVPPSKHTYTRQTDTTTAAQQETAALEPGLWMWPAVSVCHMLSSGSTGCPWQSHLHGSRRGCLSTCARKSSAHARHNTRPYRIRYSHTHTTAMTCTAQHHGTQTSNVPCAPGHTCSSSQARTPHPTWPALLHTSRRPRCPARCTPGSELTTSCYARRAGAPHFPRQTAPPPPCRATLGRQQPAAPVGRQQVPAPAGRQHASITPGRQPPHAATPPQRSS